MSKMVNLNSILASVKSLERVSQIRAVSNVNMIIDFFVQLFNCRQPRQPLIVLPCQQQILFLHKLPIPRSVMKQVIKRNLSENTYILSLTKN